MFDEFLWQLAGSKYEDLFVRTGSIDSNDNFPARVKVVKHILHPQNFFGLGLLYLNDKMGQPICLNLPKFSEIDPNNLAAVGFNFNQKHERFEPDSEKVWIRRERFLFAKETPNKNISACLGYIGGPLTYQDPNTNLINLFGIAQFQNPLVCNGYTATRIEIQYQEIYHVIGWIQEHASK